MTARFELGNNYLEILNFRHCPEDAATGNPYNTLFDLCVQSMDGNFAGVGDFETDIKRMVQFTVELEEMYDLKRNSVQLKSLIGYNQDIEFKMQKTGRIIVCGTITNFSHAMEFEFEADQTALPQFIKGLKEILREYGL